MTRWQCGRDDILSVSLSLSFFFLSLSFSRSPGPLINLKAEKDPETHYHHSLFLCLTTSWCRPSRPRTIPKPSSTLLMMTRQQCGRDDISILSSLSLSVCLSLCLSIPLSIPWPPHQAGSGPQGRERSRKHHGGVVVTTFLFALFLSLSFPFSFSPSLSFSLQLSLSNCLSPALFLHRSPFSLPLLSSLFLLTFLALTRVCQVYKPKWLQHILWYAEQDHDVAVSLCGWSFLWVPGNMVCFCVCVCVCVCVWVWVWV
jgi:hypothetical protein